MNKLYLKDIQPFLDKNFVLVGNVDFYFTNIQAAENVNKETLDWVNPIKNNKLDYILNSPAPVILCEKSIQDTIPLQTHKCLIFVENPKMTFLRIANKLFVKPSSGGINQLAEIHSEAEIANNIYIGPNTYVGKCKIGAGSVIHGNCFLYDNVTVGKNVVIHANTVIGADGFGYQRNEDGSFEKFPHIGGVIIEDDVEIGANTCIDRGALGNTIIRKGAKIDNLVHVAHNVDIGQNTAVIANAMIGGSVIVGENTWIAPSVSIRDQVTIGNNVTIGMSSLVTKSIPDDEVWIGIPAKKLR